ANGASAAKSTWRATPTCNANGPGNRAVRFSPLPHFLENRHPGESRGPVPAADVGVESNGRSWVPAIAGVTISGEVANRTRTGAAQAQLGERGGRCEVVLSHGASVAMKNGPEFRAVCLHSHGWRHSRGSPSVGRARNSRRVQAM